MDSLSLAIKKCNLDLFLDNPTEGFGNCFPNALVQQCRRPEIKTWLQKNRPWAIFNGHQRVRTKITNFALKSKDQAITNLRAKYEQVIGPAENKTWNEYWNLMGKDGTWVDHIFIQMTAWYMTLDILILTTSSKPENPFIVISGHENTTDASHSDPPLLLGNYTNVHYQSLLPGKIVNLQEKKYEPDSLGQSASQINIREPIKYQEGKKDDFIFRQGQLNITFKNLGMSKWQCPFCKREIQKIGQHLNNNSCPIIEMKLDKTELISQLGSFREGYRLDMSRKRKQRSRAKLKAERDPEVLRTQRSQHNEMSRNKLKEEKGYEYIKTQRKEQKQKSRVKLTKEKGVEVIKAEMNKQKQKSRVKLTMEKGSEVIKAEMNEQKEKSRIKLEKEKGSKVIKAQTNEQKQKSRVKLINEKGSEVIKAIVNEQKQKKQSETGTRKGI